MLCFELLCTCRIPACVRFVRYFNNFTLLALFLGIGLGILAARCPGLWSRPFPVLMLALVAAAVLYRFD